MIDWLIDWLMTYFCIDSQTRSIVLFPQLHISQITFPQNALSLRVCAWVCARACVCARMFVCVCVCVCLRVCVRAAKGQTVRLSRNRSRQRLCPSAAGVDVYDVVVPLCRLCAVIWQQWLVCQLVNIISLQRKKKKRKTYLRLRWSSPQVDQKHWFP